MKIILNYHKKGAKNSKYQPYIFIDTGYPVILESCEDTSLETREIEVSHCHCPTHEMRCSLRRQRWRGVS